MAREIDILVRAAGKDCAVVDKVSHVLWSADELRAAQETGCYPDEDVLAPPSRLCAVDSPFPGCLQQHSRTAEWESYRLVGQTEHFLIFAAPRSESPVGPGWTG